MNEQSDFADILILPRSLGLFDEAADGRVRRELLIFNRAEKLFGVFAEEVDGITRNLAPVPLPRAPAAVLGVACVRGRMLTVLDPPTLVGEKQNDAEGIKDSSLAFVVALRGDEQLALAVDRVERIIEIQMEEIAPVGRKKQNTDVLSGFIQNETSIIAVFNVKELFGGAMRGAERRRRR